MRNRPKHISIVFVFLILGIATASFSSPVDIYYNQGKTFFEEKDYPKAYEAFLTVFQLSPGNWEVDFLLGRSAFEIANYEIAIMAFERASIAKPEMVRIKLEMARAYQRLGFNDMARKFCNEVLRTNPPDIVKENINLFLAFIDKTEQRHFLKMDMILGFDWTDNAWITPTNPIINTTLGEVALTGSSSQKQEDWIANTTAQINHRYAFPYKDINWTTTGTVSKLSYFQEDELDMFYFGFESGPQFFSTKNMFGVSLIGNLIDIDTERYQTSFGFKTFYRYQLNPTFFISPSVQAMKKRNDSNSNMSAANVLFKVDTAYQFKKTLLNLQLAIENENAMDNEFSYQKYTAGLAFSKDLLWDILLSGNYNFSVSNYEKAEALFSDPRDDLIHQVGLGIKKKLWESVNKQHIISILLAYQYTQSESNIDLHEYQKNQVQTYMEYQF